ncbi:MAG: (deoxy)nucleoside triphosphate pyrophosphohydrolase [Desulfobulbus sp.]|nr:(deoxy)nucleoside triphosphate pyrophosphohydrolase [Desulfobulbus sp.]
MPPPESPAHHCRPHLQVSCAIIERDGLVLAARRSATMSLPLKWEFPGGKIDPGESPEACLVRELHEELRVRVQVKRQLPASTHHYHSVTVTLHPFVCTMPAGHADPQEHDTLAWCTPETLRTLDWAAADVPVLTAYLAARGTDAPGAG